MFVIKNCHAPQLNEVNCNARLSQSEYL